MRLGSSAFNKDVDLPAGNLAGELYKHVFGNAGLPAEGNVHFLIDAKRRCVGGWQYIPSVPDNNFAAVFSGKLVIDMGGTYTFCTTSNSGSDCPSELRPLQLLFRECTLSDTFFSFMSLARSSTTFLHAEKSNLRSRFC